ncbi:MAG: TolC family protein [Planctomycetota bacterium]
MLPHFVLLVVAVFLGCSAESYRKEADEEVYGELDRLQKALFGEERPFTVDPPADSLRQKLLAEMQAASSASPPLATPPDGAGAEEGSAERESARGQERAQEEGVHRLTLLNCLDIAAGNSRDYQRQKETVFLRVLDLTFERYLFTSRYFATADSTYNRSGGGEGGSNSRSISSEGSVGFNRQLASGGQMLLSFAGSLLKRFTGVSTGRESSSVLSLSFAQPLLSGAGEKIALEPLTQAERDAIYALRSFERSRMELAVRIASDYYRLVQQRAQIQNEADNVKTVEESLLRTRSMADENRIPLFQVDQAEQDLLRAQNRLVLVQQQYETQLDNFKVTLGLPTDAPVDIVAPDLEQARNKGLESSSIAEERALAIALRFRQDLLNAREAVEDSQRKVEVAADALRAGLDFSGSVDLGSEPSQPLDFSLDYTDYSLGLGLDLPIDRVQERNAYRTALIALEQARRSAEQTEDEVKLDVRAALRALDQAYETYEIQRRAVELAATRVDSTEALQLFGRVETRDVLEAKQAHVQALNSLDAAITDHQVSRLELLRDMGVLRIDVEGLTYDESAELPDVHP